MLFRSLAGCSPKYMVYSGGIDFSEYTARGFTISTTTINQMFEPVGIVEVYCFEGFTEVRKIQKDKKDPLYDSPEIMPGNYIKCSTDYLVDVLYNEAVHMGANGIVNLEFSTRLVNDREAYVGRGEAVIIKDNK